jgi:hypothetical protein
MHGQLLHTRGADRPRPIGFRDGRRASLIYRPRDFGLAEDRRGKIAQKTLLTQLSTPPTHPVDPAPRSLPLLPARRSSLSRSPVTSRACAGDQDTQIKRTFGALASAPRFPPLISPAILSPIAGYMYGSPSCDLAVPLPIARPSSNHA